MVQVFADKSGGFKLNQGLYSAGADYPAWAKGWDKDAWTERGVVVWDEATQRLERVRAGQALKLLEASRTDDGWRTTGIVIMRAGVWLPLPESPQRKKPRKKLAKGHEPDGTETSAVQEPTSTGKAIEAFRMTAAASIELVEFLAAHESALQEFAEVDRRERAEKLADVYEYILRIGRSAELREFDLPSRPVTWQLNDESQTLVCDVPPNRGTVKFEDSFLGWRGCVERLDCFKDMSPLFVKLEEAVTWVEQEVVKPPPEDEQDEEEPPFELNPAARKRLKRYWITPEALEPARISYRALIELERVPVSCKTIEMSFGKQYQYDKKYLDADSLGRELKLAPTRLDIEHLEYTGIYRVKSLVAYLDERLAIIQAQQLWEQSAILEQHKAGNVIGACYGLKEVETGHFNVLGVCDTVEHPWPSPRTRTEYMANEALRYTLAHALDVKGYRALTHAKRKWLSDDDLLITMHRRRAECEAVPVKARRESELWLARHVDDGS